VVEVHCITSQAISGQTLIQNTPERPTPVLLFCTCTPFPHRAGIEPTAATTTFPHAATARRWSLPATLARRSPTPVARHPASAQHTARTARAHAFPIPSSPCNIIHSGTSSSSSSSSSSSGGSGGSGSGSSSGRLRGRAAALRAAAAAVPAAAR
jgi:uncharacterized membrane protein YgcG